MAADSVYRTPSIIDAFANLPASAALNTVFVSDDGTYAAIWNGSAWVVFVAASRATPLTFASVDTTATPGDAIANAPCGRSAFANGSGAVTITNSMVTAGDHVFIAFRGPPFDSAWDLPSWYVHTAAGSFTVNIGTNSGLNTDLQFDWFVVKAA